MIIVASQNGDVGIRQALEVLRAGGSVLDALETGIRLVEDNLADHWVGTSGMPSILGEVELDASIMSGTGPAVQQSAPHAGYGELYRPRRPGQYRYRREHQRVLRQVPRPPG